MDPRVKTSTIDLKTQHDLSVAAYEGRIKIQAELAEMQERSTRIRMTEEGMKYFQAKIADLKKTQAGLASVHNILQDADVKPTTQVVATAKELLAKMAVLLKK